MVWGEETMPQYIFGPLTCSSWQSFEVKYLSIFVMVFVNVYDFGDKNIIIII